MRYSVVTTEWSGRQLITLRGPNGACASIAPWSGANLIELALSPDPNEQAVQLIDTPADAQTLLREPTRWGSPVLFPFPSRVANSSYTYQDQVYHLDPPPGGVGPARHGFVLQQSFCVDNYGSNDDHAHATLIYMGDDANITRQFPSAFRLILRFQLGTNGLVLQVYGENMGGKVMPIGFGWHPYFRLPIGELGSREQCRLQVPCAATWEMSDDLVPTGRTLPVTDKLDLRQAPMLGDATFDNGFSDCERSDDNRTKAMLIDEVNNMQLVVDAGPSFSNWVIYTPPQRSAICLEPYTCPGNAFNIEAAGIPVGVVHLRPGQSWEDDVRISLQRS